MDNNASVERLMVQMLEWIAEKPRTYGDVMDAWRSSCPRHPVWDDALREGLVTVDAHDGAMTLAQVRLTQRGIERLNRVV